MWSFKDFPGANRLLCCAIEAFPLNLQTLLNFLSFYGNLFYQTYWLFCLAIYHVSIPFLTKCPDFGLGCSFYNRISGRIANQSAFSTPESSQSDAALKTSDQTKDCRRTELPHRCPGKVSILSDLPFQGGCFLIFLSVLLTKPSLLVLFLSASRDHTPGPIRNGEWAHSIFIALS